MKALPDNLTNHFLIAMPTLGDPNFDHSVTYICEHSDEGAMGIIINQPIDVRLSEIFDQLEINGSQSRLINAPVYLGGPVQMDRGFVIHQSGQTWTSTMQVEEGLCVTSSSDVLHSMARNELNGPALVALGYAGWAPGQLESELKTNSWLTTPADQAIIFEAKAEKRWELAAAKLGIDPGMLSSELGHA